MTPDITSRMMDNRPKFPAVKVQDHSHDSPEGQKQLSLSKLQETNGQGSEMS